jgi:hypothetical protein
MRLLRLVATITYLHNLARHQSGCQLSVIEPDEFLRHLLKHLQFVLVDIGPVVSREIALISPFLIASEISSTDISIV